MANINPGDLLKAHASGNPKNAARLMSQMKRKVAVPPKGEMGMVMKRKGSKFFGEENVEKKKKRKGTAHINPAAGFQRGGKLHEEKVACKVCKKTSPHRHKAKTAKKA